MRKREEFFLGRLAGKRAATLYVLRLFGLEIEMSAFDIRSGVRGVPYISLQCDSLAENFSRPLITISHAQGIAASLVASPALYHGIGIDVESIRSFSESTSSAFMTQREYKYYTSMRPSDRPRVATLMWTLKEAYLKALQVGLRIHPGQIDVLPFIDQSLSAPHGVIGNWTGVGRGAILSTILFVQ